MVQAAKTAAAAALAWLVARLFPSPQSFMAPYAAVFLMSATVYRSMLEAARQTVALLLGLLVAYLAASTLPHPVLGVLGDDPARRRGNAAA
ncbi:MAG: FUSC family protein [Pseudonocardia sp.]|nr:FUSC family protein [Pseudonocardia sp.]